MIGLLCAAMVLDASLHQLAADAKLALKRADLSLDFVSWATGVPVPKLSDQLNGKQPFTSFCRFFNGPMRETEFLVEFLALQGDRVDGVFLRCERLAGLVTRMDVLLGATVKPIAKMSLPSVQKERVS